VSSRLGSSTEKIDALNDYAKSPLFNDAEKVALEYADAITDTYRDVDDELFDGRRPASVLASRSVVDGRGHRFVGSGMR